MQGFYGKAKNSQIIFHLPREIHDFKTQKNVFFYFSEPLPFDFFQKIYISITPFSTYHKGMFMFENTYKNVQLISAPYVRNILSTRHFESFKQTLEGVIESLSLIFPKVFRSIIMTIASLSIFMCGLTLSMMAFEATHSRIRALSVMTIALTIIVIHIKINSKDSE